MALSLPAATSHTHPPSLHHPARRSLAARYEYDKNYVRDKLLRGPEISGFSFDVDAHVGTMNASLGDLQNLASTSIPDSALMSTIIGGLSGVGADAVSGPLPDLVV